jgi:hypothetical protein
LLKEDKKEYFMCQYQFFMENMKMKKNGTKKFELPRRGFEPWFFEQVPAQNLNFEGD